ncbi:MAG TPA: M6 family metalloprotease domain-containing protein, partial [Streptomyces sp.]|nr:M6 family metalloprotease domain-containing protein [Streptomyces sp.]
MRETRPRIRTGRRAAGVAAFTCLSLAAVTSAGSPLADPTRASAGPVAAAQRTAAKAEADASAISPCQLAGAMGVQMSEGMPTPPGYSRSTGDVRAL